MGTLEQQVQEQPTTVARELNALDRCDGCGAAAYNRVTLKSGGILLFCKHHGDKHKEALSGQWEHWHDETEFLQ